MTGTSPLDRGLFTLSALAFAAHPFVSLGVGIGPWNAPVTDVLAVVIFPLALVKAKGQWTSGASVGSLLEGCTPFLPFLVWTAMILVFVPDPNRAIHDFLRQPLFHILAYGWALPLALRGVGKARLMGWIAPLVAALGLILAWTSAYRILGGGLTWIHDLRPLTTNHKTLAVALAPWLPLLASRWHRSSDRSALALGMGGALVSISRASWAAGGVGLVLGVFQGGKWMRRPLRAAAILGGILVLLAALPQFLPSQRLRDASITRQALWEKALQEGLEHPLTGAGPGGFPLLPLSPGSPVEATGLDAHGFGAKVLSETGWIGLLLFTLALGRVGQRVARRDPVLGACMAAWLVGLSQSTDTFSCAGWMPLAVILALSQEKTLRSGGEWALRDGVEKRA